jgi:hypothetical protein
VNTWIDVPGAGPISFGTTASSTVDVFVTGSMTAQGTPGATVNCAVRFVIDGAPTGDPMLGDRLLTVTAGQWAAFTAARSLPPLSLAAGAHTAKLQLARVTDPAPECQIDSAESSAARLFLSVR